MWPWPNFKVQDILRLYMTGVVRNTKHCGAFVKPLLQ